MIAAQVQKCNRELDAAFDALYRPARLLQKVLRQAAVCARFPVETKFSA